MKARMLFIVLATLLGQVVSAQVKVPKSLQKIDPSTEGFLISAGIYPGIEPRSGKLAYGGDISIGYPVKPRAVAFLSAGITRFDGNILFERTTTANSITSSDSEMNNISMLTGGMRFTPWKFFISAEAGASIGRSGRGNSLTNSVSGSGVTASQGQVPPQWRSSFLFAPMFGFVVNDRIDLGIRYQTAPSWAVPDQVSMRVAYRIR